MKKKYKQVRQTPLQKSFFPLEKEGLSIVFSAMAQNLKQFGGCPMDLYKRIKMHQPQFLFEVSQIIEGSEVYFQRFKQLNQTQSPNSNP